MRLRSIVVPLWGAILLLPLLAPLAACGDTTNRNQDPCKSKSFSPRQWKRSREIDSPPLYLITPYILRQAYGVQSLCEATHGGAGQTVVVLATGGLPPGLSADLTGFSDRYDLPPVLPKEIWPKGDPHNTNAPNDELEGDIESIHAIAPNAAVAIVVTSTPIGSFTDADLVTLLTLAQDTFATDPHTRVLSMSFADAENNDPTGKQTANDALQRMATAGWSLLAGSGDWGAYSGEGTNAASWSVVANFPASSPWVTAVGGTELQFANGTDHPVTDEVAWNESNRKYAHDVPADQITDPTRSGGGVSRIFPEPSYQLHAFAQNPSVSDYLLSHRGVPDVAADASSASSMAFQLHGHLTTFFGTSEATPIWAGMVALANAQAGVCLGFLNDSLYSLGSADLNTYFRDIQENTNRRWGHDEDVGYNAMPGFDLVTGWGSPHGDALFPALIALRKQAQPHCVSTPGQTELPTPLSFHASGAPLDLATGPDGAVWFTELETDKIGRITSDGAMMEYPLRGQGDAGHSIVLGSDHNLWVTMGVTRAGFATNTPAAIGRITLAGALTTIPLPPSSCPDGNDYYDETPDQIAQSADGSLWFIVERRADISTCDTIGRITLDGHVTVYALPYQDAEFSSLTRGTDGNIWVAGDENQTFNVWRFAPDGTYRSFQVPPRISHFGFDTINAITAGPDGNLWFTNDGGAFSQTNAVVRMTLGGQFTPYALGQNEPHDIVVGPDHNVWLTEVISDTIVRVSPAGAMTTYSLAHGTGPQDLIVGPDGFLWFTEEGSGADGSYSLGRFAP
jgi:streptogramin lyase